MISFFYLALIFEAFFLIAILYLSWIFRAKRINFLKNPSLMTPNELNEITFNRNKTAVIICMLSFASGIWSMTFAPLWWSMAIFVSWLAILFVYLDYSSVYKYTVTDEITKMFKKKGCVIIIDEIGNAAISARLLFRNRDGKELEYKIEISTNYDISFVSGNVYEFYDGKVFVVKRTKKFPLEVTFPPFKFK